MAKPTLYMLVGYPGAGKTTAAKILEKLTGALRLSSDELRVKLFPAPTFSQPEHDQLYGYLDKKTEELLRAGKSVIYDANLNRYQHRKDKYTICDRINAKPVLLWVKTAKELAKERALHPSRQHLWPPFETPDKMFERITDVFEEPGSGEPYISLDGTKITPEYITNILGIAL